jgi:hypothetical protein
MRYKATGSIVDDAYRAQLKRARALLEMFEEDRGRRAASIDELRDWVRGQYPDRLQIRMNRRLHGVDAGMRAP